MSEHDARQGHDHDTVPLRGPAAAPPRWPGKRALTDSMSAPRKPAGAPARWLPNEVRDEARERGQSRVLLAHTNYKLAIEGKRIELALTKESGWGFAAELIFGPVSYGIVGALARASGRIAKAAGRAITEAEFRGAHGGDAAISTFHRLAERVRPDVVRDALSHLGRATRSGIKERAHHVPPLATSKAAVLALLGQAADQHAQAVLEQALPRLDDDSLLLLVEAYDVADHSREAYGAAVDELLARFESQGIADIGETHGATGTRGRNAEPGIAARHEAVRFTFHGRERVALVDRPLPAGGEERGLTLDELRLCQWVRWIDEDLSPAAAGVQAGRLGSVLTLDVESGDIPPTWLPMVSTWIATVPR